MNYLICELCNSKVTNENIARHLQKVHNWKVLEETTTAAEEQVPLVSEESVGKDRCTLRNKKSRSRTEELRTCPYCSLVLKNKLKLVEHVKNCPKKKVKKTSASVTLADHNLSYEWAIRQPLPNDSTKLVRDFIERYSINELEKELTFLCKKLSRVEFANSIILKDRLVVCAHAKLQSDKAKKKAIKKKKLRAKGLDILDMRGVVFSGGGGPGTGKRR
ncbi:hypothetical protein WCN91_11525 [Pseudoalteromonas sp. YIC-827]|uniref:C2H2-type domain-containing protein n=1 Tax=Pseudoalteromonas qingdaonensis TaxID=3131913 RepID=A0ABU9N0C9_9GAMM